MHAEIKATSELSLIILQLNFRMDRKVLFNIISVHELLYLRQFKTNSKVQTVHGSPYTLKSYELFLVGVVSAITLHGVIASNNQHELETKLNTSCLAIHNLFAHTALSST